MGPPALVDGTRERRLWVAYLSAQALLGVAWWCALALMPTVRGWFELMPDRHQGLDAFLIADLTVFIGGSAITAWALWHRTDWAVPAAAFTAGGVTYAAMHLAGWVLFGGTGSTGLVIMVISAAATCSIAFRVWQTDR